MSADLVFINGGVYNGKVDPKNWPTALAVTKETISEVGDGARDLIGKGTEVVDLADKMLIPGFYDAHVHPVTGGLMRSGKLCDLSNCDSQKNGIPVPREVYIDACVQEAARFAVETARVPPGGWVQGFGWSLVPFGDALPHKKYLDENPVLRDRKVFLQEASGHTAWVNQAALDDVGPLIPSTTTLENGVVCEPIGTLHEMAAGVVQGKIPPFSVGELASALKEGQKYLHSLGIVGWLDAGLDVVKARSITGEAYLFALQQGKLTARVSGALIWTPADKDPTIAARLLSEQIGEFSYLKKQLDRPQFRVNTAKIFLDGIVESRTAALIDPYLDPTTGMPTDHHGDTHVPQELLRQAVKGLLNAGLSVHVHAIGDQAVRDALQSYMAAPDNKWHSAIAHLELVAPEDRSGFQKANVIACIQPLWATHEPQMDQQVKPLLGPVRTEQQYPFASILRTGARLAAGSDWPVSTPNPLEGIHVAVNRSYPPSSNPLGPDEALTLKQALDAYTVGAAYACGRNDAGVLAPGMRADLAVLDRNIFLRPADEIARAHVNMTFVGGERVFEAATP
ncbi:amidohydrolase [Streptomyces sp. H51]|uniref:amidohydrolase n=1 Tax=Streptomyces sp. H51 TaxID=3111770 RepID=UPI002D77B2B4|nr:amidohydrolase [Streptomyces sp. H51]